MRSIVVGDKDISRRCLKWLQDSGEEAVGFSDGKLVPTTKAMDDAAFAAFIKALAPDAIFSIQARRIFRKEVIAIPPRGVINLHYSLLPRNRGMYPVAWALMNGDAMGGVTLHYIDEGIDTGNIISQYGQEIPPDWTAGDLYQRYEQMAFLLFKSQYPYIKRGDVVGYPQREADATYHDRHSIDFSRTEIDWNQDTERVYGWIRALIFPGRPGPTFDFHGTQLEVLECRRGPKYSANMPGVVVEESYERIAISTLDGSIAITKVRTADGVILTPSSLVR